MKGADKVTTEELNNRLKALEYGDKKAFEEIYNEFKTSVFTVVYRITGDRHLSEDILQEFFVKLYKKPPETPLTNPRAYLMRIAHNLTVDALKSNPQNGNIDDYENLIHTDESADERIDLNGALDRLSSQDRRIVILHVNGGLKFREIADITAIPLNTVLWRYRKAIKSLRDYLNGR